MLLRLICNVRIAVLSEFFPYFEHFTCECEEKCYLPHLIHTNLVCLNAGSGAGCNFVYVCVHNKVTFQTNKNSMPAKIISFTDVYSLTLHILEAHVYISSFLLVWFGFVLSLPSFFLCVRVYFIRIAIPCCFN